MVCSGRAVFGAPPTGPDFSREVIPGDQTGGDNRPAG